MTLESLTTAQYSSKYTLTTSVPTGLSGCREDVDSDPLSRTQDVHVPDMLSDIITLAVSC